MLDLKRLRNKYLKRKNITKINALKKKKNNATANEKKKKCLSWMLPWIFFFCLIFKCEKDYLRNKSYSQSLLIPWSIVCVCVCMDGCVCLYVYICVYITVFLSCISTCPAKFFFLFPSHKMQWFYWVIT